jgi:3',5'-cyclic AMP phosphodiesterase CpdA
MLNKQVIRISLAISMISVAFATAYVGTTSTPVPNRVSASPSSWLSIAPGSDASQLCFSWATLSNNSTSFKYHPIFQADTVITYTVQAPGVQIVKVNSDAEAATVDFATNPDVKTFWGISLKSHATVSNKDTLGNWYQNKVTVSGLQNSSIYAYRVGYGTTWSGVNTVKTQNPSAFSFIAVGDPQLGSSTSGGHAIPAQQVNVEVYDSLAWQQSVTTILSAFPNASFLMSVGDEIENTSNLATNNREYTSYLAPLELLNIPVANLIGNHDAGLGQYFGYHFNFANQSSQYGVTQNGNDGDYWFTYGNALFINLNSMTTNVTTHDVFIGQAVAANPNAKWKIISFHHALFSTADHPFDTDILFRRGTWTSVIDKYGIDVVLAGHDHCYSRSYQLKDGIAVSKELMVTEADKSVTVTDPQGTLYMELNTGSGAKYYDLNALGKYPRDPITGDTIYPAYAAANWQGYKPSFSSVTIDSNSFQIVTYVIDDLSHPIDNYKIVKHNHPIVTVGLTANGSTGSVTLGHGQTLKINLDVNSGDWTGVNGEYWIYADCSNGKRYCYQFSSKNWNIQPTLVPAYQTTFTNVNGFNLLTSTLPYRGTYTFRVIIDNQINGIIDETQYKSSLTVVQN